MPDRPRYARLRCWVVDVELKFLQEPERTTSLTVKDLAATTEQNAKREAVLQVIDWFGSLDPELVELQMTARLAERPNVISRDHALRRWPRIVAHLISESLGYFTPQSAANALAAWHAGLPNACEWYSHLCSCRGKGYFDEQELRKVGDDVLKAAIRNRHSHDGYMSNGALAKALVERERRRPDATAGMLAGWF